MMPPILKACTMKLIINVAAYKQPRGPHSFVTYEFAFALYAYASLVPQIFSKRGGKKGSMHYLADYFWLYKCNGLYKKYNPIIIHTPLAV